MTGNRVDALVIFGATGDLAKLETFPALVGLVERGVLDFPVVGVAKSGWGLEQFRDYAVASLPIVIRAGKCMAVTATEVTVRFRHPPRDIFGLAPLPHRNQLRFRSDRRPRSPCRWRARSRVPGGSRRPKN